MSTHPASLRFALLAFVTACGGGSGSGVDAGASEDAAPIPCAEQTPLTIGQCIESETGNPCVSADSETQLFVPLEETPLIHPIIGLQGSPMFVFAVQAQGIAPGEDLDAPEVAVRIYDGEEEIGGYTSRPILHESAETPGLMTAPRLFVVSFFADELEGKTLDVTASVEDRLGQTWCKEASFEVGSLIDAPPLDI